MNWTQADLDKYLNRGGKVKVLGQSPIERAVRPKNQSSATAVKNIARARLVEPGLKFRSKTERRAWENYQQWLPQPHLNRLVKMKFEPIVFHLAGGNYTPDFMLVFDDGEMWFVEVKGSWKAYQSGRSSKRNLKQAAAEFGWIGKFFALLPIGKNRWQLDEFTED